MTDAFGVAICSFRTTTPPGAKGMGMGSRQRQQQ
jgi:hypothetical protein